MKESYEEDLANDFGLQRKGDCGNNVVLSVRAEGQTRYSLTHFQYAGLLDTYLGILPENSGWRVCDSFRLSQ